jgi:hypothetical protein
MALSSSKFVFVLLCCHGNVVSPWRVPEAHLFGVVLSQHIVKIPELSNDTSFDSGVLLVMEMWHFQVQNSFCLVVLSCWFPWSQMIHKGERKWASEGCSSSNHSYTKYSVSNHCQRATKWGLVGQMSKLWEDKWLTETEDENWWAHTSWQHISQNESFLWKWIHVISELVIDHYSGIDRYMLCEILSAAILVH